MVYIDSMMKGYVRALKEGGDKLTKIRNKYVFFTFFLLEFENEPPRALRYIHDPIEYSAVLHICLI